MKKCCKILLVLILQIVIFLYSENSGTSSGSGNIVDPGDIIAPIVSADPQGVSNISGETVKGASTSLGSYAQVSTESYGGSETRPRNVALNTLSNTNANDYSIIFWG